MLKYALVFLGLMVGPALAASDQQPTTTPSIAKEFAKTDSGSGTPFDRLIGAIAAQRAAQTAYGKGIGERMVADSAFLPAAKELQSREEELSHLSKEREGNNRLSAARGDLKIELGRAIERLKTEAKPLEAAFLKKGEAEEAAKVALAAADLELAEANVAWSQATMEPALREVTTLASTLAKVTAERDQSLAEREKVASELTALRSKKAEFCSRNPGVSLCLDDDKVAEQK